MPHFDIYKDTSWRYRWRLTARDGTRIAESTIGYREKDGCLNAIGLVKQVAAVARVVGAESEETLRPGSEASKD